MSMSVESQFATRNPVQFCAPRGVNSVPKRLFPADFYPQAYRCPRQEHGVSKNLGKMSDPKQFKGLTVVTSPDPDTNYSVMKKLVEDNRLKLGRDTKILQVNPGTEIGAMLAGRADKAVAYQPRVAAAEAQGAKIVFDFASYMGPFCNTGIMVLESYADENPDVVLACAKSFEEASWNQ